ncbi:hypothetical protein DL771_011736 [Monosporascus sp. 5C6A]|nr:hypothetical protein DL771_011736 [Monosporascus sp. 5C6A]
MPPRYRSRGRVSEARNTGRFWLEDRPPNTKRETGRASPRGWIGLSQWYMEPLLVKYASNHGFHVCFQTGLVSVVVCAMRDLLTGSDFEIRTKYAFGPSAAGARWRARWASTSTMGIPPASRPTFL